MHRLRGVVSVRGRKGRRRTGMLRVARSTVGLLGCPLHMYLWISTARISLPSSSDAAGSPQDRLACSEAGPGELKLSSRRNGALREACDARGR
jgi:hypothetical protein